MLLTNIRQFTDMEVVLLFTEHDFTVPIHFREKWGCSVFVYPERDDMSYIPSVRPWLMWQYFKQNPQEESEQYFYIDSDIIFREFIDCATLSNSEKMIQGSDCDGYIGYGYISGCEKGDEIFAKMAEICGADVEQMKLAPGIGAHIILNGTSAEFWKRCYFNSNEIYHYLETIDSNIQKWTAEMWAQQWGWVREGYEFATPKDLEFCTATDSIERYDQVKIMHNAGVTLDRSHELFFKGRFVGYSPFHVDLNYVRQDKCSYEYVKAIRRVVL